MVIRVENEKKCRFTHLGKTHGRVCKMHRPCIFSYICMWKAHGRASKMHGYFSITQTLNFVVFKVSKMHDW